MNRARQQSNFSQLQAHDEQLERLGMLAERYFADDPNTCLLKLRQLAEGLAQSAASRVGVFTSGDERQVDLLRRLQDHGILPREDVALIDIDPDDGRAVESKTCLGATKQLRASKSIEIYGLNLGNLITARKRAMREVKDGYENLMDIVDAGTDMAAVDRLQEQLRRATTTRAPYARAARAKLIAMGAGAFCAQPEDVTTTS